MLISGSRPSPRVTTIDVCWSMSFNFASKGQLWPVLAVLATKNGNGPDQDKDTMQDHGGNEEAAFWEVPYVQALQLSISYLKGAFNLQCKFEARRIKVQKMNMSFIFS